MSDLISKIGYARGPAIGGTCWRPLPTLLTSCQRPEGFGEDGILEENEEVDEVDGACTATDDMKNKRSAELRELIGCPSGDLLEDLYCGAPQNAPDNNSQFDEFEAVPLNLPHPLNAPDDGSQFDEIESFTSDLLEEEILGLPARHVEQQAELANTINTLRKYGNDMERKVGELVVHPGGTEAPVVGYAKGAAFVEQDMSDSESETDDEEEVDGTRAKVSENEASSYTSDVDRMASSRICEKERMPNHHCCDSKCQGGSENLGKLMSCRAPRKILESIVQHSHDPENCTEIKCWVPGCGTISLRCLEEDFLEKLAIYEEYFYSVPRMVEKLPFLQQNLWLKLPKWYKSIHIKEGPDWGGVVRFSNHTDTVLVIPTSYISIYKWVIKRTLLYSEARMLSFKNTIKKFRESYVGNLGSKYLIPHIGFQLYGDETVHNYCVFSFTKHEGYPLSDVWQCSNMPELSTFLHELVKIAGFLDRNGIIYPGWTMNKFVVTSFKPFSLKVLDFSQAVCTNEQNQEVWEDIRLSVLPAILPPELFEGCGIAAVHVWGLACTVFQLVTGHMIRHKFRHAYLSNEELRNKVYQNPVVDLQCIQNEGLRKFLKQCFQVSPQNRPSCDELPAMIDTYLNGQPIRHYKADCGHLIPKRNNCDDDV